MNQMIMPFSVIETSSARTSNEQIKTENYFRNENFALKTRFVSASFYGGTSGKKQQKISVCCNWLKSLKLNLLLSLNDIRVKSMHTYKADYML